ncbi:MAG: hypothetical protein JSS79_05140 [Bacteroidetes bacterium]|nr:hypothetical protein [Bacteroidota bacterium]
MESTLQIGEGFKETDSNDKLNELLRIVERRGERQLKHLLKLHAKRCERSKRLHDIQVEELHRKESLFSSVYAKSHILISTPEFRDSYFDKSQTSLTHDRYAGDDTCVTFYDAPLDEAETLRNLSLAHGELRLKFYKPYETGDLHFLYPDYPFYHINRALKQYATVNYILHRFIDADGATLTMRSLYEAQDLEKVVKVLKSHGAKLYNQVDLKL